MKPERFENVMGYLRSVIVSEIIASESEDVTTYLKQSKRVDLLLEFEAYIDSVIKQNVDLRFKLSKSESKRLSLQNDIDIAQSKLEFLEMG